MLNKKKIFIFITTLLIALTLNYSNVNAMECSDKSNNKKLTIMMYMDADNDLEDSLLKDIEEVKKGHVNNPNLNVIVLIDRIPGYSSNSSILNSNFTDTRLYKIENNNTKRLSGSSQFPEITKQSNYEANMGDATTLKKFIDFCKSNYAADKYMLIMSNHGGGAKEKLNKKFNKSIGWDFSTSNGDCIYTGEFSDVLTKNESVDILAFDACLMGTAEVAYQFRPGNGGFETKSIIASAPSMWQYGFQYDKIFNRLVSGNNNDNNKESDLTIGGKEQYFNPSTITNKQLGALFVEEQRDSVNKAEATSQQLSYYDLTKINSVKKSVDALAHNLRLENKKDAIEKLRGSKKFTHLIHYFDINDSATWASAPYFDLYDLCEQISINSNFSNTTKKLASTVMNNVDNMIIYSFGGKDYSNIRNFKESKNGLSIFLPDGSNIYNDYLSGLKISYWKIERWYNPLDTIASGLNTPYGKLSWCKNGINPKINTVGNWFELLDSWYDCTNDSTGGYNHFQW